MYVKNGWNWVHLMGAILVNWLMFFIICFNLGWSLGIAMLPTVLKEIGDGLTKKYDLWWMVKIGFDPAGPDKRDIGMAIIGSILGSLAIVL